MHLRNAEVHTLLYNLIEHTAAALAKGFAGEAAGFVCLQQRFHDLLSAGHDEIDARGETARLVGAIVSGGEPVGHDNAVESPLPSQDIHAELPPIVHDAAIRLCEMVRETKRQDTGNVHVEQAKQYLSTHLTQEIRTEDVAEAVGVSPYHLSRLFKALTGQTMREYLTNARIEAAKQLLAASDRSLPQIASLLRFCDQSYFTCIFRKQTGITPGQYRKEHHR